MVFWFSRKTFVMYSDQKYGVAHVLWRNKKNIFVTLLLLSRAMSNGICYYSDTGFAKFKTPCKVKYGLCN